MDILRCTKEFDNPRDFISYVVELIDILKKNQNAKFKLVKVKNGFEDFDPNNVTTTYRDCKVIIEYTDGDFKETVEVQCVLKD